MRFYPFLLVAVAALLSNGIATATVSMTSADAPVSVRALEAKNGPRSLRYYDAKDDDENDKYDEDEEERGVMTAEQIAKWTKRAKRWVKEGKTPHNIKEKLSNFNGVMSDKDREKYLLFLGLYGTANRHVLNRI